MSHHCPILRHQRHHRQLRQFATRQSGVVIVVALFIVALVATMAYIMMASLERDTNRTTMLLRNRNAEFYAQGSIAWAIDALANNLKNQKPDVKVDDLPLRSPVRDINGFTVFSIIYDLQARYNVNSVVSPESQTVFAKLIQSVDTGTSKENATNIARAVSDWVNVQSKTTEFSKYYFEYNPPYQAAHRPLVSTSELLSVKGMTEPLYNALKPYIAAYPSDAPINVQTADIPVIMTIGPMVTLEMAKAIKEKQATFVNAQSFANLDTIKNNQIPSDKISITSQFFLVETDVSIENQRLVLYTLLERKAADQKVIIRIVWQSKGIW